MYRAVDQRNRGTVCLLEEFSIPDRVADRSAILQQKFTLEMQRFEHWQGLPGFVETIVDQNRVFIVQSWGDHASYHQVLEDRVRSGEGAAELEEVEAVELLDGLEPLLRSLSSAGLAHGYVCRNTIVWLFSNSQQRANECTQLTKIIHLRILCSTSFNTAAIMIAIAFLMVLKSVLFWFSNTLEI